jgi:hypothetical protein
MNRIKLSRNLQGYKLLLVVALLFFGPMMIAFQDLKTLLPGIVLTLVCLILLYWLHFYAPSIEFDEAGLYISSRKHHHVITYQQVHSFGASNILINGLPMSKIYYEDLAGTSHTVRFLPKYKALDRFLKQLKSQNQRVEIDD